jgi:hypothetical protein
MPKSPVEPVTVTEYEPVALGATVNDADTTPLATEQTGFEMRVGEEGDDEIVQGKPESPAAKFVPEIMTFVPAGPEAGTNVRPPVTVKLPVPLSPLSPKRVKTRGPVDTDATTKEHVIVPALAAVQAFGPPVTGSGSEPSIVEATVSVNAKPVPVTVTVAPAGAAGGEAVTTCGMTLSVVDADTVPSLSVIE